MATLGFGAQAAARLQDVGNPLLVGLDPHLHRLPERLRGRFVGRLHTRPGREAAAEAVVDFLTPVVTKLSGRVWGVKPQSAFFEQLGGPGFDALETVCAAARDAGLLVVLDAKRGDISSTAAAYAHASLHPEGPMAADAVTVNPWMGVDTLMPFLEVAKAHGRGLFVLARTTNPGSALLELHGSPPAVSVLARELAALNADHGRWGPLGVVVGAQAAAEASALRDQMPGAWFLVPGLGAQGGGVGDALAGADADGQGALPAAARSVLFGSSELVDPGDAWADRVIERADGLVDKLRAHAGDKGWDWGASADFVHDG